MAISDAEQDWFRRARKRLADSHLDDLTMESTAMALSKAETALDAAPPEIRMFVESQAALGIAFAHFASGSPRSAADAAAVAVAKHADECRKKADDETVDPSIKTVKRQVLLTPNAIAIVIAACILRFGEGALEALVKLFL